MSSAGDAGETERQAIVDLVDAADRSVDTLAGASAILEALALCGDLGRDKDDALMLVSKALDGTGSDLANASGGARARGLRGPTPGRPEAPGNA